MAVVQRVVYEKDEPAVVVYRDGRTLSRFLVTDFVDDFDRVFDREAGYRWSPQVGWSFETLAISTRDGDFVVDPSSGFIERLTPSWTDGDRGVEVALARMLARAALLGLPTGAAVGLFLLLVARRQRLRRSGPTAG